MIRSSGRTLLVPIDHGTAIPVPGLENPAALIEALSPWADGFVVNYGVARACRSVLDGLATCLRTDVYKPALDGHPNHGAYMTYGAADAIRTGARSVMHMLYPHHPDEARQFRESARLISECHAAGLQVITEALPYGLGQSHRYTPENISFAVRAAWPGDREAFRQIVSASCVPVIVLGGAATDDAGIIRMVAEAIEAGAAGIAIGRNVWQHAQPSLMLRRLHSIVHEGATADEALALV
jgi:DhnA family fructose-bisphosphate aldolase class Ia